jgi:hypothetical protein
MTVIEIKRHRWGLKIFEALACSLCFSLKKQTSSYAKSRASFRSGEIRILDSSGNVERVIPSDDTNRRL